MRQAVLAHTIGTEVLDIIFDNSGLEILCPICHVPGEKPGYYVITIGDRITPGEQMVECPHCGDTGYIDIEHIKKCDECSSSEDVPYLIGQTIIKSSKKCTSTGKDWSAQDNEALTW